MAKVKLEGAIRMEFEVKYGLSKDVTIRVHAIDVGNGKKVLIGEGDISNIPEKVLSFIGDRIESILKRDKRFVAMDGFGKFVEYHNPLKEVANSKEIGKAMYNTELGTLIMRAYKWQKPEALEKVLQKNLFPLTASGMKEFVAWKKVKERGGSVDSVYKYLR